MAKTPVISVVPQAVDLDLYAGDGVDLRLTITDGDSGALVDVTGAVLAQVRQSRDTATPAAQFSVQSSGAAQGVLVLALTGLQTGALMNGDTRFKGVWDVQWTPPSGQPRTLVQGVVTCQLDVTRSP